MGSAMSFHLWLSSSQETAHIESDTAGVSASRVTKTMADQNMVQYPGFIQPRPRVSANPHQGGADEGER